jgi:hypothetical protein
MALYVKVTDGAVDVFPYPLHRLKTDFPNTSFPKQLTSSLLSDFGIEEVTVTDAPSINELTQKIDRETTPALTDGTWTVGWTVTDKTQDEIDYDAEQSAIGMRLERDNRLAETDWWAVSDRTMTAEQTSYRQALRDITTHANWPYLNDDDWPTKP